MSKKCDLLITNAKIVDGSGAPAFEGGVAISGDTIVCVGAEALQYEAERVIDAAGRYVTPGFVDIHTHVDIDLGETVYGILRDRPMENMVRQGITTTIGGNCGMATTPVREMLAKLDEGKCGPNVGLLAAHGTIRMQVVGMEARPATAEELEGMKNVVRDSIEAGAFGMSTGLGYAPGNYADTDELVALCEVVKDHDAIYTSHIRDQSCEVRKSWDEVIEIGRRSGARVHISHFQVIGERNWGAAPELIAKLHKARENGLRISGDAFPYEGAGWSLVGVLMPNWVQAGGAQQGSENLAMKARLRDPELLPRIKEEIRDLISLRGNPEGILFLSSPEMPELNNRFLSDVCAEWNMDPVDAVIKIALETSYVDCTGMQCCIEDKQAFYESPYCSVASDSNGALLNWITKTPTQPRNFGCFPKFLEVYVKERKVFSFEEAIRKMTSLPAETIGINDRGLLKEGMKADVVVLDLDRIHDNATYTDTVHYPSGIDDVIINGKVSVLEGKPQHILSGCALRFNGRK